MRNISFFLTTDQVRNRTKTVTRRMGWHTLKPGTLLNACVKCQGLKKGERIESICTIRVADVRRERLSRVTLSDVTKEGFPTWSRDKFISFFLQHIQGPQSDPEVTRIEFDYVNNITEEKQQDLSKLIRIFEAELHSWGLTHQDPLYNRVWHFDQRLHHERLKYITDEEAFLCNQAFSSMVELGEMNEEEREKYTVL